MIKKTKSAFTLIELLVVMAIIATLAALLIPALGGLTRSDGERAGIVTKFSHKGIVWTTWEGELHYAGANGTIAADSWVFTIDNSHKNGENVAQLSAQLLDAQRSGKRVRITYKQPMWKAPWRGDTSYFVQSVDTFDQ